MNNDPNVREELYLDSYLAGRREGLTEGFEDRTLIDKVAEGISVDKHGYNVGVKSGELFPFCTCGWSSGIPYDVDGYDRHLAEVVLAVIAEGLRKEGWARAAQLVERGLG